MYLFEKYQNTLYVQKKMQYVHGGCFCFSTCEAFERRYLARKDGGARDGVLGGWKIISLLVLVYSVSSGGSIPL